MIMTFLMERQKASTLSPLKHHNFRCLLIGRMSALFGGAIAPIALAFAVLDLTHSAMKLGIVLASRSLPLVIFVVVGGVIADKFPRGRIIMASNTLSGLTQGLTATLLLTHHANIMVIALLEFIGGISGAFLFPALAGLTPRTVPDEILQTW
jgi:MFS family permease